MASLPGSDLRLDVYRVMVESTGPVGG